MDNIITNPDGTISYHGSKQNLINIILNELTPTPKPRKISKCPLCKQNITINRDKQTDSSSKNILNLYYLTKKYPEVEWFSSQRFCKGRNGAGRFAALRYHNFIIEKTPDDENTNNGQKKNSGMWKLTELGIEYCEGKIKIPRYVLTQNRKFIGTDGPLMSINEFLKEPFDYREI